MSRVLSQGTFTCIRAFKSLCYFSDVSGRVKPQAICSCSIIALQKPLNHAMKAFKQVLQSRFRIKNLRNLKIYKMKATTS